MEQQPCTITLLKVAIFSNKYEFYLEGYPNNVYGDCIHYMTTGTQAGQWASGSCNETMSFVCELPATIYGKNSRIHYVNVSNQFQMTPATTTTTGTATRLITS